MSRTIILLLLAVIALQVLATGSPTSSSNAGQKIKNIILIIGDGMGPAQIGLLEAYARQAPNTVVNNRTTAFKRILEEGGSLGMSMTYAADVIVADSAAAASQLATGKKSGSEMVGMDYQGNPSTSILEYAQQLGKSTGLVSDTRITHATPASFAAHQSFRGMENEIALQMLDTAPDVMLSGGLRHWIPQQANDKKSAIRKQLVDMTEGTIRIKSKRKDDLNLLKMAEKKGYQLAFTKNQLDKADAKILGLFAYSGLPYAIGVCRVKDDHHRTVPTLTEMSEKAISVLSNNDKGFFLMIESGLIDWAAHLNDTGTVLHEMLSINEVMNYVLDWAKDRDDTLIIVTADHETGGLGFSHSAANLPKAKKFPGKTFPNRTFKPNFNFGHPTVLDKIYKQKISYAEIFFKKFDTLPKEQQTAKKLMGLINHYTEFDITKSQASRILETEDNKYYLKGHKSMNVKTVPKMDVNSAFFIYPTEDNRQNLLAIEVATSQSVVWSTGSHTATPVMVYSSGNKQSTQPFVALMTHPQLGQKMIDVWREEIQQ